MAAVSTASIKIGSQCTLMQAQVICDCLIKKFASCSEKDLLIDMSDVEQADVTLVQILIASRKSALTKQISVAVKTSTVVDALLNQAGLGSCSDLFSESAR